MAWNDHNRDTRASMLMGSSRLVGAAAALLVAALLGACSVTGPRESPLNEVTAGSPTVSEVYRGQASAGSNSLLAREQLHASSPARPVAADDARQSPYWSPLQPLQQRFARVPNPDLVMVVFPHLARGKYPVPGYVTVFPMYEQTHYALPGEIEIEHEQARTRFVPPAVQTGKSGQRKDRGE